MKTVIENNAKETTLDPKPFMPKTPLGKKLLVIRSKIIAGGLPLLSQEEIEREVAERRGGFNNGSL